MDEHKLPSPEELFSDDTGDCEYTPIHREEIPEYRIVKTFSLGFILLLAGIAILILNMNRFGVHVYSMVSGSMESVIPQGSLVVCYETDILSLEEGDIITYEDSQGRFITHRIQAILTSVEEGSQPTFVTKGTENQEVDREVVTTENIRGEVLFHIPYVGRVLSGIIP